LKKSTVWIGVVAFALLVIGMPFILDWFIIGNEFPSNISNSDWVSFYGGYIGAILGAMFSLFGIAWTIKFTREQNRADRELQIRPYFDIRYLDVEQFCHTDSWLGYVMINTWDANVESETSNQVGAGLLYLKNVGNGPATNINFEVYVENIKTEYTARYTNQNTKVTTNSILQGNTAELSIDITNSRQAPKKEDFVWQDNGMFATYDVCKFKIPDPFSIKLILSYSDLMSNRFCQELIFDVRYSMQYGKDKDGRYHCELHLKEIGAPKILKNKKPPFAKRKEKH
jgi:hypothetical protein